MTGLRLGARSLAVAALCGCPSPSVDVPQVDPVAPSTPTPTPTTTLPSCDPALTWQMTGSPFLRTWCDSCHAGTQPAAGRLGAPEAVTFDTLDEARAWADRISARALATPATMPPATTIPEEVLAPFRDWMACGLPGEDDATAAPIACTLPTWAGDLRTSEAPVDFCARWSSVGGELTVDADPNGVLGCVCDVTGGVTVDPAYAGPAAVSAPHLAHAARILVQDAPLVASIDLPALAVVDGDVGFSRLTALRAVEMPSLVAIDGDFVTEHADQFTSIGVYRLADIGGDLVLDDLPALTWFLPLDSVTTVGGDVLVHKTGVGAAQDLRRIGTIGGSLEISENPDLVSLEGYDALYTVGADLVVRDNPVLASMHMGELLSNIGGDLIVTGNPALPRGDIHALTNHVAHIRGEVHWE